MKKVGYLLVLVAGLFYGCTETEEINDSVTGKAYYPLSIGDYRIYNVTHVRFEQDSVSDSTTFQLRERVDTLFTNLAGEPTFKLIRSIRTKPDDSWRDDSVITITVSSSQLRRTSDNLSLVKMVFPVSENKTWNPNVFNTLEPGNARYVNVNQPYAVNGQNFPNTATVQVNDFVSVINKDVRTEVYAENVGLIYKDYEVLQYCNDNQICDVGVDYILFGYRRTETLESYGKTE
ncbi:hypothetical protein I5M27_07805 [Adhaeribacter sp. BT258]|uniref:NigD-like protein n=1 Tax=Adhaeribacter terrigena TaxID=2793070 RepID=A0ABS1C0I2_9BACT|nr:hypothetical protein [Adhaeribacter terrigena]MBK0402887.1 hypothetical protein [Adhaeribacter terrigena]